ncbi:MAG: hypothetical protein H0U95_00940 [Bacteroidetes bacterium]|nr:hypothetical protein [Bacteroidota bacterium]
MVKQIFISFLFFFSLICIGQQKTLFPPAEFYSCWKSSHEENNEKAKTEVYRPCTYTKFPPSMFRLEIEFFITGKCKYLHVGPTDIHYYVDGKWGMNKKTRIITVFDDKGKLAYKYKLKTVKKDELVLLSVN